MQCKMLRLRERIIEKFKNEELFLFSILDNFELFERPKFDVQN